MEESNTRTSLKYLYAENFQGRPHNVWISSSIDTLEVKKAGIKANLIAGTYKVQTMVSKFQKGNKNDLCQLCKTETEDIPHFILTCPGHSEIRKEFLNRIFEAIHNSSVVDAIRANDEVLLQLIFD